MATQKLFTPQSWAVYNCDSQNGTLVNSMGTLEMSAHVYFSPLSIDCRPIGRPTYRSTVDQLPADSRPTVRRPIGRQSTDSWVTVGRLSVDSRSTYRPTVGRHPVSRLTVGEWAFVRNPSVPSQEWNRASFFLVELAQTPDSTGFGSKPVLTSHWKALEAHPQHCFGRLLEDIAEQYPV